MQQTIQPLGHDVTEFLRRRALRIGEWVIAELGRVAARPAKPSFYRIMVKEKPILIINFREERDGLGRVHSQERTANEDVLVFSRFPVPMTDNRVIGEIDGTHADRAIRPEHGYGLTEVGSFQVPNIIVHEKDPLPAQHPGQQQAEIALSAQIAVRADIFPGKLCGITIRRGETELRMSIVAVYVHDNAPTEVS
jgi:hypothetical protein